MVSTQLVNNENACERDAQTQKKEKKEKERDDLWRNAKSTMSNKFSSM